MIRGHGDLHPWGVSLALVLRLAWRVFLRDNVKYYYRGFYLQTPCYDKRPPHRRVPEAVFIPFSEIAPVPAGPREEFEAGNTHPCPQFMCFSGTGYEPCRFMRISPGEKTGIHKKNGDGYPVLYRGHVPDFQKQPYALPHKRDPERVPVDLDDEAIERGQHDLEGERREDDEDEEEREGAGEEPARVGTRQDHCSKAERKGEDHRQPEKCRESGIIFRERLDKQHDEEDGRDKYNTAHYQMPDQGPDPRIISYQAGRL